MALALTTAIQGREFHIFLILILMLLTIYFCHSFVRLFMIASRAPGQVNTRVRFAEMEEPIRITFARDVENAAGEDTTQNQAITSPPPAYGLWRGSMVCFFRPPHFSLQVHSIESNQRTENKPQQCVLATRRPIGLRLG